MELKDIEILEQELAKNTEILDYTFDSLNLKPLSVAYSGNTNNGSLTTFVEFVSQDSGKKIFLKRDENCIYFKINLYEDNKLLCSYSQYYAAKNFNGYDTIKIRVDFCNAITRATSARLFVSKNG